MRKHRETTAKILVIDRIICNKCGEDIPKNELEYHHEHIRIEKEWGYGSGFDGETHEIDLCHECYEEIICMLKIKP